jgi:uncharacterized iron-regulated membrane protein
MEAVMDAGSALYRTLWRWHFYAGLFVIPFILILSVTGAIYLFKPQTDRFEERAYQGLSIANAVSPDAQLDAAIAAFPGARFDSYRLPEIEGDAAMIHLGFGDAMRDVYVSPQGKVLGSADPDARISAFVHDLHGELQAGKWGGYAVELAGNWAIVMILTGLYLWWPARRGLAGVMWPRLGKRTFWRDIHAVTGFWVSGFALVLLVSGLPWTSVWGDGFDLVREKAGWVKDARDWRGGIHAEHDHAAMMAAEARGEGGVKLSAIVAKAKAERLAFPVLVSPPGKDMVWSVKSNAQNRPLRAVITYDMMTGVELSRSGFADKHVIDRIVGYGIAWHEGHLFGWVNQLIGLLTAIALFVMAISGFVLWRRRKSEEVLGAPPLPHVPARIGGVVVIILLLAALLPLLAVSLIILWLIERLILPRLPKISHWLGVARRSA